MFELVASVVGTRLGGTGSNVPMAGSMAAGEVQIGRLIPGRAHLSNADSPGSDGRRTGANGAGPTGRRPL